MIHKLVTLAGVIFLFISLVAVGGLVAAIFIRHYDDWCYKRDKRREK